MKNSIGSGILKIIMAIVAIAAIYYLTKYK